MPEAIDFHINNSTVPSLLCVLNPSGLVAILKTGYSARIYMLARAA